MWTIVFSVVMVLMSWKRKWTFEAADGAAAVGVMTADASAAGASGLSIVITSNSHFNVTTVITVIWYERYLFWMYIENQNNHETHKKNYKK